MTEIKKRYLKLKSIKPYKDNPRINQDAVEKVKKSIELYGYNKYIAVDKDNTIVVGHTRFEALKQLGTFEDKVTVIDLSHLKPGEIDEYRLVDNKASESSKWDERKLEVELRGVEDIESLEDFFDTEGKMEIDISPTEILKEKGKSIKQMKEIYTDRSVVDTKKIVCRNCGKSFNIAK